jgi:hypothetical protein
MANKLEQRMWKNPVLVHLDAGATKFAHIDRPCRHDVGRLALAITGSILVRRVVGRIVRRAESLLMGRKVVCGWMQSRDDFSEGRCRQSLVMQSALGDVIVLGATRCAHVDAVSVVKQEFAVVGIVFQSQSICRRVAHRGDGALPFWWHRRRVLGRAVWVCRGCCR